MASSEEGSHGQVRSGAGTEAHADAERRWPGFGISLVEFEGFLRTRTDVVPGAGPSAHLVHAADLYLVCACLRGVRAALDVFYREYVCTLRLVIGGQDGADDVRQALLERLLVGPGGGPGKLAAYSGRSSLRAWLRVVAKRVELNVLRGGKPRTEELDTGSALVAPGQDPELEYMSLRYASEYRAAFRQALASLEPRQRLVLRMVTVEGATGKQIAALMGVSRVTVVRWIAQTRQKLLQDTLKGMQTRCRLSPTEFESITRLVQSRLDFSLSQLLGSAC